MKEKLVQVERKGSWFWCIFWLLVFFPIGILYWLIRMGKKKTYEVKK